MKNRLFSLLFVVCMILTALIGLTACDDFLYVEDQPKQSDSETYTEPDDKTPTGDKTEAQPDTDKDTDSDTDTDTDIDTDTDTGTDTSDAITPEATVEVSWLDTELDTQNGKNAAKITVGASIVNDLTASFDRLEIYDGQTLVLTDTEYEGFSDYCDLNSKTEYTIKLYYSSEGNGYTERVKEVSITTPTYELPEVDAYSSDKSVVVGNHAIFGFSIEKYTDMKYYDVIVRAYTQNDSYFAPFIVEMLDDPTLLDDLQKYVDKHYMSPGGYVWEAQHYISVYHNYLQAWEHKERVGYSDDRWREIAASGKQYVYELNIDNGGLFVANDEDIVYNYYAVLRDYFDYEELRFEIYLKFDLCDGTGSKEINMYTAYPYFRAVDDGGYGFAVEPDENIKNGYVFTETDMDYKVLYVHKLALYKGFELVCYVPFEANDITSIDTEAWLNEWIEKLKREDPNADKEIVDRIEAIPAMSFKFIAGTDVSPAGDYSLCVFYRSILEDYTQDDDVKGYAYSAQNICIKIDLEAPENIKVEGRRFSWDVVEGADEYVIYVNGEQIFTTRDNYYDNYGEIKSGDKVRIVAIGRYAYDSEPSDEYTFIPPQLNKPAVTVEGRTVSWNPVENATKYVYTVNGQEYETWSTTIYVNRSATVRIKAVDENGIYLDSEWTAVTVSASSSDKEK